MQKSRVKHPFTLLELCISLLILILIASVCTIKIKDLIDRHRFNQSVSSLVISLQEAQGLAVSYQIDLECDLFTKEGKKYFHIQTDAPLKLFDTRTTELSQVSHFKVNGKKQDALKLKIYSSGRIEPTLLLTLSHKDLSDSDALWLDLQTPLLIKLKNK